jgi:chaperonin GroEL (HSP60 family)
MIAQACLQVMKPGWNTFSVDSVRVNKIVGGSFEMSALVNGMVIPRDAEGASHTLQ